MKIHPVKSFRVNLIKSYKSKSSELSNQTDLTDSLVSTFTDKLFRGQVDQNSFKVIPSKIGIGSLCVAEGNFIESKGEINIRINSAFKVLISILYILPIATFIITIMDLGFQDSLNIIPAIILSILFLRFVFINLSFKYMSNKLIKDLEEVLEFKILTENNK